MIRYKVVMTEDRSSVFARDRFTLTYEKGKVVEAEKGTLGIMVFDTLSNAKAFQSWCSRNSSLTTILRVRPMGKGKKPVSISECVKADSFISFYSIAKKQGGFPLIGQILRDFHYTISPPMGTICYKAVEVLD